jgi:hypothetical protein
VFSRIVDETEIGVGVEEVLRDRAICPGVDLGNEVLHVRLRIAGLRMHFRIARDFDVERCVEFLADEFDQFAGIAEIAVAGHARRQISAQRDDAAAAHCLVFLQQAPDFIARTAHARQVRRGVQAVIRAQMAHGLGRIAQGRTPGAERDADIVRLERLQFRQCSFKRGFLLVGLWRKKFQADFRR